MAHAAGDLHVCQPDLGVAFNYAMGTSKEKGLGRLAVTGAWWCKDWYNKAVLYSGLEEQDPYDRTLCQSIESQNEMVETLSSFVVVFSFG